jgi:hypothetical protein
MRKEGLTDTANLFGECEISKFSLMMEAVRTSETSVDNHFTRQYNPEDSSEHHTCRIFAIRWESAKNFFPAFKKTFYFLNITALWNIPPFSLFEVNQSFIGSTNL